MNLALFHRCREAPRLPSLRRLTLGLKTARTYVSPFLPSVRDFDHPLEQLRILVPSLIAQDIEHVRNEFQLELRRLGELVMELKVRKVILVVNMLRDAEYGKGESETMMKESMEIREGSSRVDSE